MVGIFWRWIVGMIYFTLLISCNNKSSDANLNTLQEDFVNVNYVESHDIIGNPERGFYNHYSFSSSNSNSLDPKEVERLRNSGTSLLLNLYYLNDFKNALITDDFLERIKVNMEVLREAGSKCILRFAYSSDINDEPFDASEDLVLKHIEQLRPLLIEYSDVIYVMEAGFIGVWGEWYYTSNFNMEPTAHSDYEPRKNVLMALLSALPNNRMVCLRTPKFKLKIFDIGYADTITTSTAYNESLLSRVASHNDCFLASSNDMGTFSSIADRKFWQSESKYTIMGGETCSPSKYSSCDDGITQMEKYHWSYLNSGYNMEVLNSWEDNGCMDEIAKRLGYRLVLSKGQFTSNPMVGEKFKAQLKLKNVGFAAPSNPRSVELIFVSKTNSEKEYVVPIDSDPRFWFAGGEYELNIEYTLPKEMKQDEYTLYLNLPDPQPTLKDRAPFSIRLANDNLWDSENGYNKLHSIIL